MITAVFILNSGLKHYNKIKFDKALYYDPKNKELYPKDSKIDKNDTIILVDNNVATGKTLIDTMENLGLKRNEVLFAGSYIGNYPEKFLDIKLEPVKINGYIIAFAGDSGVGKSLISKGLELYRGIKQYKIGYAARELNPGLYGENIDEAKNPYTVSEKFLQMYKINDPIIIIDGIKNIIQLTHISYALNRPYFLFNVASDNKEIMYSIRQDKDDAYYKERREYFKNGLQELQKYGSAINTSDFNTFVKLAEVLNNLGYTCKKREWGYDIFGTKHIWLDIYEKYAYSNKQIKLINKPEMHTRYVKKYGLDGKQEELIMYTATSFRIIDDILDEHDIRNNKPSHWKQYGLLMSEIDASALIQKARKIAEEIGYLQEYDKMFRQTIDAVRYEIDIEERKREYKTFNDWLKVAEKETAFRSFIGLLKHEDPHKYYIQAIKAQIKDDLIGAKKGGRKDTDTALSRPLFKKEFFPELLSTYQSEELKELLQQT